jgi:hypothetical protein
MQIKKFGVVILTNGPVRVEDWLVEREPSDPIDATNEQLLLDFAITWAERRFDAALQDAARKALAKKLFAKLPKKIYVEPTQTELKRVGHIQWYGQAGENPMPCRCVYCLEDLKLT